MRPVPGLLLEEQPSVALFAMVLCGEARGSGRPGMEAVAESIANRLRSPKRFGDGLKAVLLRPYAYSCLLMTDPNRPKLMDLWKDEPTIYSMAEDICARCVSGALPSSVGDATHYVTTNLWGQDQSDRVAAGKPPRWYSKQCIEEGITKDTAHIGGHVFATTA